jgi:hypothetical protein
VQSGAQFSWGPVLGRCGRRPICFTFAPSLPDTVSRMSEKPESDEFEEEETDEPLVGDSDVDLDQVTKELDMAKRRGQKVGDPAWRRLERLLEDKRTAELTSDFEDYDIGLDDDDEEPTDRALR